MPSRFILRSGKYEHSDTKPDLAAGSVRRVTYGAELKFTAQVPLKGRGSIEIHGYAAHYNSDRASVDGNDDNVQHLSCWVPAADVRRPAEGEGHGDYVAR